MRRLDQKWLSCFIERFVMSADPSKLPWEGLSCPVAILTLSKRVKSQYIGKLILNNTTIVDWSDFLIDSLSAEALLVYYKVRIPGSLRWLPRV